MVNKNYWELAVIKDINQFISLTKENFKTYLGIAISVVLFIQFFQPFAIERFSFENKLLYIAGFGLIILIFLTITQIIFQNRLIYKDGEKLGNPIFMPLYFFTQAATSSLAFIFYLKFVGQSNISFNLVVRIVLICISLPVTIYIKNQFNSYQLHIRKLLQESRQIQEKLKI